MTTPQSGTLLDGRYELGEQIGEGGFARVFSAVDRQSEEAVAVKFPNYEGSSNDPGVVEEYFAREARTLGDIAEVGGHPNVMTLRDQGTAGDTAYLVVEHVDGYELDEAIDRTGPLEENLVEQVRQVGIDLCDAMSFLHGNEIVYRDLKPDNVMLTAVEGRPKPILIDFNTATGFDDSGARDSGTTILGPYKPPEIAAAGQGDARLGPWSDVYSIGKILLFLLKGTIPQKDGVNPRDFGVDCEPYLADIVEKATRSACDERYQNATAMKHVLSERDPASPPEAALTFLQTGDEYTLFPGDTLGRWDTVGPTPSIAIEDDGEYISTVQVQFDVAERGGASTDSGPGWGGKWKLRDRSLNGTYVQRGDGWQRVLSENGRERLRDRGEDPTDRHGDVPPAEISLSDGDVVALVHPSYGVTFQFEQL